MSISRMRKQMINAVIRTMSIREASWDGEKYHKGTRVAAVEALRIAELPVTWATFIDYLLSDYWDSISAWAEGQQFRIYPQQAIRTTATLKESPRVLVSLRYACTTCPDTVKFSTNPVDAGAYFMGAPAMQCFPGLDTKFRECVAAVRCPKCMRAAQELFETV